MKPGNSRRDPKPSKPIEVIARPIHDEAAEHGLALLIKELLDARRRSGQQR